jgi:multidrug efflux pump subunit AcrA (membrane-fusion protein)
MWMRVPGNNKRAACLAGVLALVWLVWGGYTAWGRNPEKAADKGKEAAPAAVIAQAQEVAFIGKFSCTVKRGVILPFQGIITSLQVQAGQKVKAGEVLARYHLTPEAAMQLRRRLSPPQVKDLEAKLAEVDRALNQAAAKRREIEQLADKQLASKQALAQAEKEWTFLSRQRQATQAHLRQEQQLATDDLQILKESMGDSLNSAQLLKEKTIKSPIDGYVLFVYPDLREGAELGGNTVVFQVGVMDPLVVKAQVHEMESLRVKVGDLAEIQPESLPGRKFEARVSRLSWLPMKAGLEQPTYYEAEFEVPNPDLTLKDGMKVRIVLRQPR